MSFESSPVHLELGSSKLIRNNSFELQVSVTGEKISSCQAHIGGSHRGLEKFAEVSSPASYRVMMSQLSPHDLFFSEAAYVGAIEKSLNFEIPERAVWIRMIMCEFSRILSHLWVIAASSKMIGGSVGYGAIFRTQESILEFFKELTGNRFPNNFSIIGGVNTDLNHAHIEKVKQLLGEINQCQKVLESLLTKNNVWIERTRGVGKISQSNAIGFGLTGIPLRGSNVNFDVRKKFPYLYYSELSFECPIGVTGDVFDRHLLRAEEISQSILIIEGCLSYLRRGAICGEFSQRSIPVGKTDYFMESPTGFLKVCVHGDGSQKPWRVRIKSPSFTNLQGFEKLVVGTRISDSLLFLASMNICGEECDR